MNSVIQELFKKIVNQWRGKTPPTEDQMREMFAEDLRKNQQVAQLRRQYGIPGP
jgi:hypothetical protein